MGLSPEDNRAGCRPGRQTRVPPISHTAHTRVPTISACAFPLSPRAKRRGSLLSLSRYRFVRKSLHYKCLGTRGLYYLSERAFQTLSAHRCHLWSALEYITTLLHWPWWPTSVLLPYTALPATPATEYKTCSPPVL